MAVIPFYGSDNPTMFAIERAAMDRSGRVIDFLDTALPAGLVLDVGAGDGMTAERLTSDARRVVPLEPAAGMVRPDRNLPWVRGDAAAVPFADGCFTAAYSTWAYFFTRGWDPSPGIAELHRVVIPGGPLYIVDNAGNDEFTGLADEEIGADPEFWRSTGFTTSIIETEFVFDSLEDARTLLGFFFGEAGRAAARLRIEFRVAVFVGESHGPGTVPS